MEVHFTPEQEKRLTQVAANAGTDPERLVKDAALRLLEQQARPGPSPSRRQRPRRDACLARAHQTRP